MLIIDAGLGMSIVVVARIFWLLFWLLRQAFSAKGTQHWSSAKSAGSLQRCCTTEISDSIQKVWDSSGITTYETSF
jgi:hypothetical protein